MCACVCVCVCVCVREMLCTSPLSSRAPRPRSALQTTTSDPRDPWAAAESKKYQKINEKIIEKINEKIRRRILTLKRLGDEREK